MPALLINLKIDAQEKFELFKVTLADLSGLFEECHIKIRGTYSRECIEYAKGKQGIGIYIYQELQESDWVAATLEMLNQVESRSVFLYFEDHRLVASKQQLEQTLADFDKCNLDHLCYSFFKASQLDVKNLLPLGITQRGLFYEFYLSMKNIGLLGKILGCSGCYTFSLVSLNSVEYFRETLLTENKKYKLFNQRLTSVIARLFRYPRYKKILHIINGYLSSVGARLCAHSPSSPFNLEKIWFEYSTPNSRGWKFGVLREELFANFDDDNGAYGESLIKRGLYPFDAYSFDAGYLESVSSVVCDIALDDGESFDCTYYSHKGRIRCAPQVEITVASGCVTVLYQSACFPLSSGESRLFYSNMSPVIQCIESSKLKIKVFDEIF